MERRQFLAAGGLVAGGAFAFANATVTAEAAAATPSTAPSGTDDFHYGFTGYDVTADVESDVESGALASIDVSVAGERIDVYDAVTIQVSVTNEADDTVGVVTGPPAPFGPLWFGGVDADGGFLAWSDGYGVAEPRRWETCQNQMVWPDVVRSTEVAPGETVTDEFRVSALTHGIQPGSYEGSLSFGISRQDDDESWRASVETAIDVEPVAEPTSRYERSLEADATNAEDFDGRLDVEVLETVTETRPGRIGVTFTSEWDERRGVETLRTFPIGRFVGESADGSRLVLQAANMYAPGYLRRDGCWRSTVLPCADESHRWEEYLEPGESIRQQFVVLGHPDDDCPPAGDYRFTAHYETDGEDSLTKEKQAADLGFSLSLGDAPGGYEAAMTPRESASSTTPTPSPTPAPEATSTTTATERTPASTGTNQDRASTETGSRDGGSDAGDVRAADRARPDSEAQRGLGFGAAVGALTGWLAAQRVRDRPDD